MLVKQAWRILNQPNTLPGKSLKAKYFPSEDLSSSKPENHHTWIWKVFLTENTEFCIKGNGLLGLEYKFPSATQLGTAAQPQNKPSKHI